MKKKFWILWCKVGSVGPILPFKTSRIELSKPNGLHIYISKNKFKIAKKLAEKNVYTLKLDILKKVKVF